MTSAANMTSSTIKTKEVKKKVYLSKNKKILFELINQDKKDKDKDGSN